MNKPCFLLIAFLCGAFSPVYSVKLIGGSSRSSSRERAAAARVDSPLPTISQKEAKRKRRLSLRLARRACALQGAADAEREIACMRADAIKEGVMCPSCFFANLPQKGDGDDAKTEKKQAHKAFKEGGFGGVPLVDQFCRSDDIGSPVSSVGSMQGSEQSGSSRPNSVFLPDPVQEDKRHFRPIREHAEEHHSQAA